MQIMEQIRHTPEPTMTSVEKYNCPQNPIPANCRVQYLDRANCRW